MTQKHSCYNLIKLLSRFEEGYPDHDIHITFETDGLKSTGYMLIHGIKMNEVKNDDLKWLFKMGCFVWEEPVTKKLHFMLD